MDEAERCHRLAYLSFGRLLARGTAEEVVAAAHLTTWSVSGPDLRRARRAASRPARRAAGRARSATTLHVSGDDAAALERAIAPFRAGPHEWRRIESGLEDVFIHLMDESRDNVPE